MNRLFISLSLLFGTMSVFPQDTIQISKKYKTVLIFPDRVVESILGNSLTFNVDAPTNEGKFSKRIVKLSYNELAKEKKDFTNYLVITEDGSSYEFTLQLKDIPDKLTWYINDSLSVRSIVPEPEAESVEESGYIVGEEEDPSVVVENRNHFYNDASRNYGEITEGREAGQKETGEEEMPESEIDKLYDTDRREYYRKRCYYMQFDKPILARAYTKKGNIYLWLKGLYYNRNEIYVQFRLENKESVDLDISFIRFSIATSYKKASSKQNTELKPVFMYKMPKQVLGGEENHFVVVFSKFGLNENKKVLVELDEQYGNRDLTLEIDNWKINNPVRF